MYIYIYCIYISHKKISRLPPPRCVARVACALGKKCSDIRLLFGPVLGGFCTGFFLLLLHASLAARRLTTSLFSLLLSFLPFFFIPPFGFFLPPRFLHLCFLGTKSSRLVSENTINKMNHDTESLLIHNVRGWYDERVARRRSPSSLSVGGGVVTVEDLYIYTYIYIYVYVDIYIYSGTQMAAQSMRRRGNLSQEENRHVCMEGPVGRSGRVVGSAMPHGPACPLWAENSEKGEKKGLGDRKK